MSLRDHFPFAEIRPSQQKALDTIEEAYRLGKRFIIVEAPTGVGKSGIAMAVASWAATEQSPISYDTQPGAYILSTQKSLTAQYVADPAFARYHMAEMRGKSNFTCVEPGADGGTVDCSIGEMLDCGESGEGAVCHYKLARCGFISNPIGVTNFAYFLASSAYARSMPKRTFLIVDECHNAEKELLGFYNIELTQKRCKDLGIYSLPVLESNDMLRVRSWLEEEFLPIAASQVEALLQKAQQWKTSDRATALVYIRRAKALHELREKLAEVTSGAPTDWFSYSEKGDLILKRLSAAGIAQPLLFRSGERVLLMSATILDSRTFMRNLGIPEDQAVVLKLDSDFPIANRPVIGWYAGDMRQACIEKTLPKLCQRVEEILDACEGLKGIIHTHSYKITQAVMAHLARTKHRNRMLTHDKERGAREAAIQQHSTSGADTVLISPSMYEGLDLKGDLSRFQIICKVPYPALDPYIVARKDRDPQWYLLQTGLSLIQASGRSVRTASDWAYTFILDGGFGYFFRQNAYLLSPWWVRSVSVVKEQKAVDDLFDLLSARAALTDPAPSIPYENV